MRRVGRYEVLEELGRGSMGAVYKARDPQIGRVVALKVILTANLASADREHYRQRFQREAQAAGQMSHPGIITIHDIAEDESGQPYLVMEFVDGTPLDRLLGPDAARLPFDRCLDLAIQVAEALDYAHRRGVVHRDIKPANILITAAGDAKITDFGIAKLAGAQMTQAGQLLGTPAFMSPEQFSGSAVDARSDLFSLGATLYWMLTGERPFAGETLTVISFQVVYRTPVPVRQLNPDLPADVETLLSRCLAKTVEDRYSSCRDLADDLRALRDGRAISARALVATPAERTVAMPASLATAAPQHAADDARPMGRERRARPQRRAAAALALLLALAAAGYWLWPRAERPARVASEPSAAPAAKRMTPSGPPARKTTVAAEPAAPAPPPGEETLRQRTEEIFRNAKKKPPWAKGKGHRN